MKTNRIPTFSEWLNEDYWEVDKGHVYTMYHATLKQNVPSIKKEGIHASKRSGLAFSEDLVWMADTVEAAKKHAESRAKKRHEEGQVVVLKLKIDPRKVQLNRSFTKGVYNVAGDVPPSMIDSIMEAAEAIPGGLADGKSLEDIAKKHGVELSELKRQHEAGVKVESEHTSDPAIAAEIAKDHLFEDPDYYVKLKKVEESAEAVPSNVAAGLTARLREVAKEAKLKLSGDIKVGERDRGPYKYQATCRTAKGNLIAIWSDDDPKYASKLAWVDDGDRLLDISSPIKLGKWEASNMAVPTVEELEKFHSDMRNVHKIVFGYSEWLSGQPADLLERGQFDPEMRFSVGRGTYQSSVTVDLTKGIARIGLGYSPNGGGWGGPPTQWESREVRIPKSMGGVAPKVLSLKLWAELAKPVLAKNAAAAQAFSDYLRSKYPNGIPAWPHIAD